MMRGENIVCFAKDWGHDPTSVNHVMKTLGRDNRILWLNSIAARTPSLGQSSDVARMLGKLRSFARGPRKISESFTVYTPIVLPLPHSSAAVAVNAQILRATVGLVRRSLGMQDFQLWSFLPISSRYADQLGASLLVYYCVDEWTQFSNLDGARIGRMEAELCRRADLVFCTARTLVEKKQVYNPETHLASHGVDHAHFSAALDEATPLPPALARLPKPVLGFFGLVQDWIDVKLLAYLARQRPSWSVVVIGDTKVDVSELRALPNVLLTGRLPYEELPRWCKGFDLGLCPFVQNELTRNVNPIKLREYLSAGLPVVSTYLPELAATPEWCSVATDHPSFLAACERELAQDSPARRRQRADAMRAETWEAKCAALGEHVERVKAARARRRA
jgi:glycosyltransferase involved in cell wall biosynthesis